MKAVAQTAQLLHIDMLGATLRIDQEQTNGLSRTVKIGVKVDTVDPSLIAKLQPYFFWLTANDAFHRGHSDHGTNRTSGINPEPSADRKSGYSAAQFDCFCAVKNRVGMTGVD